MECVVVERDWPEFEPTRKAIEARVSEVQQAQEPVGQGFLPMDTAPTNGQMVRLLVDFEDNSLEDTDQPVWTIGACYASDAEEEVWQFAGWNWSHDCFTEGHGKPVGWLPMLEPEPKQAKTVMSIPLSYGHLDANALEKVSKEHPNEYFLKGSGVLKLITAIRELEQNSSEPEGYKLVPVEPTPEIIAAAAIAVWPIASKEDIELARKAAPIVLMQSDLGPEFTVEMLVASLATMAPAYRAMVAASGEGVK
jgi:hypothetical protein